MAVVHVHETYYGARGGGGSLEYSPAKTIGTATRTFEVKTDAKTDDETVVAAHASIPNIGAAHPNNSAMRCLKLTFTNDDSKGPFVWYVTAFYSNEYDIAENPLLDAAQTEWDTEQFSRIVWKDRDGNPIVNSAGDPFDPPVEKDDSRWISVTSKNVGGVPAWIYSYQDAINAAEFTFDGVTVPARTAKVQAIHISTPQERNGISYRVLQITMHHRGENVNDVAEWGSGSGSGSTSDPGDEWDPWDEVILDAGFRKKVTGSGSAGSTTMEVIKDADDNPVASPVPLDGSGDVLDDPSLTNNVFLGFQLYVERDFSALPLT